MDRQMYFVALNGVTRYALSEAVKAVHRNALGHPYFPQPSELRRLCDEAQSPVDRQAERQRFTAQQLEERRIEAQYAALRTPAAKAKVSATYAKFCEAYEQKPSFTQKLDPLMVAQVPDAKPSIPHNFKQARVA